MFMRSKTTEINKKISMRIKLERTKRYWSQEELAEYAGLSSNTIGRIERNQISPSIDTVVQIACAFKLDFLKLIDYTNL